MDNMNNKNIMEHMNNSPIMGEIPNVSHKDCDGIESPLFLSHAEAGALFNAIGFCCTSIKAMQCVVQEPVVGVLVEEEMVTYQNLRMKLFTFLNEI